MTDKERIVKLEERIAQLEGRLALAEAYRPQVVIQPQPYPVYPQPYIQPWNQWYPPMYTTTCTTSDTLTIHTRMERSHAGGVGRAPATRL